MIKNSRVNIVLWVATATIGLGLISCVLIPYLSYQSQLRHTYSLAYALGLSDQDLLQSNRHCSNLWTSCGPTLVFETDLSLPEFEERMEQLGTDISKTDSGFPFVLFLGSHTVTLNGQDYGSAIRNPQLEKPRTKYWSYKEKQQWYRVDFTEISTQPGRLAYEGRPFNRNVVSIFVRPIP
jgi:hypothetical protein